MPQNCRRAKVQACEAMSNYTADARPPINTVALPIKLGDIVDVGIQWGDWLKANCARLKTSAWAAAGSPVASPQAPTIVAQSSVMDEVTGETACLLSTAGATIGDTYYLENTIVVERDGQATPLALADRTLTRRIHVKVAAG